jgi:nicotinate dehydrogenase subunit A
MVKRIALKVNGRVHRVEADASTPLLYVLRNDIGLNGAKFGCGLGQCGACTVVVGGSAVRSCQVRLGDVGGEDVHTIEGLGSIQHPHPLQHVFIEEQSAQCGYCINGMIMTASAFLQQTPHPTEAEIRDVLANNLCRCGTHTRIIRAVARAAKEMKA